MRVVTHFCFCGIATEHTEELYECSCGSKKFKSKSYRYGEKGTRVKGKTWPRESDALGVKPWQIEESMERDAKMGCPATDYNPKTGNPIYTSYKHEREFTKKRGYHKRNSYL